MLFQSPAFLFVFLPVALLGFALARRWAPSAVPFWLIGASMVFYAWWSPAFLLLLALSTAVNFALGLGMGGSEGHRKKVLLALGLGWNLAILGYFKYRAFFAENWNALFGTAFPVASLVLPLGISFFSFQKVAYLIDVYKGTPPERRFSRYVLFVFFFPQLIAGPIVHPGEILPQMATAWTPGAPADWCRLRKGWLFLLAGLVKKVLVADNLSRQVSPVFDWVAAGGVPTFLDGWCAALGYAFQLYFDFSGYSDMAIGLALLFGIRLPFNFDSPYLARSIQEFWQRWHMTLSRFIKDYVYIPLGGGRCA
ncbi:MAG TPA: MBOAT family O-acyltransferase, partial [Candidatus Methylacidiphilales bacterium]